MPRITLAARQRLRPAALAPHDQRVLAVVGVVAAAHAAALEAEALVQVDRARVRDAHLERVAAAAVVLRQLEQRLEQPRRDAAAAVVGVDGDVHHVPGVDVARVDDVADELVALERAEADRRRLGELGGEHRARPRRRVGALSRSPRCRRGRESESRRSSIATAVIGSAPRPGRGGRRARRRRPGRSRRVLDEQVRARKVVGVVVGRHLGARGLEDVAMADGAVADEPHAGDVELLGPREPRARS